MRNIVFFYCINVCLKILNISFEKIKKSVYFWEIFIVFVFF